MNHLIFILLDIKPFALPTSEVVFCFFLLFSFQAHYYNLLFLEGTGDSFPFPRRAGGRVIFKLASLPAAR